MDWLTWQDTLQLPPWQHQPSYWDSLEPLISPAKPNHRHFLTSYWDHTIEQRNDWENWRSFWAKVMCIVAWLGRKINPLHSTIELKLNISFSWCRLSCSLIINLMLVKKCSCCQLFGNMPDFSEWKASSALNQELFVNEMLHIMPWLFERWITPLIG